jgi:hypothetical protein
MPTCPQNGDVMVGKKGEATLTGTVAAEDANAKEVETPSQAQRPEGLPSLIGPLGYEAGR